MNSQAVRIIYFLSIASNYTQLYRLPEVFGWALTHRKPISLLAHLSVKTPRCRPDGVPSASYAAFAISEL